MNTLSIGELEGKVIVTIHDGPNGFHVALTPEKTERVIQMMQTALAWCGENAGRVEVTEAIGEEAGQNAPAKD